MSLLVPDDKDVEKILETRNDGSIAIALVLRQRIEPHTVLITENKYIIYLIIS